MTPSEFPHPTRDTVDLIDTALRELASRRDVDPDDPITALIGLITDLVNQGRCR